MTNAERQRRYRAKHRRGNVNFSSKTFEWGTPQDVFDKLAAEFHFTVDVCATAENAKCERFFTKVEDGLSRPWPGVVWMNPPYGREIGRWVENAQQAASAGALVVGLVPSRTGSRWWRDFVMTASEVRFLPGRLRFGGAKHSAPFDSAVVIWRP